MVNKFTKNNQTVCCLSFFNAQDLVFNLLSISFIATNPRIPPKAEVKQFIIKRALSNVPFSTIDQGLKPNLPNDLMKILMIEIKVPVMI